LDDTDSSKWTYQLWMEYLKTNTSCDVNILELKIREICVKACITIEPQVYNSVVGMTNSKNSCFEL